MVVGAPASIAVNDILRFSAFVDSITETFTVTPSGWVQAPNSPVTGPDNHRLHIWYKRAVAGDVGATTYSWTKSAGAYANAAIERYTGAITTGSPWDVTRGVGSNVSQTTTEDVAVTTTVVDTLLCWTGTDWSGGNWTPPTGFTERRDTGDKVCTSADKPQAAIGGSGAIVGTCATADKRCAWVGALKSPAASTPQIQANAPVAFSLGASSSSPHNLAENTPVAFSLGASAASAHRLTENTPVSFAEAVSTAAGHVLGENTPISFALSAMTDAPGGPSLIGANVPLTLNLTGMTGTHHSVGSAAPLSLAVGASMGTTRSVVAFTGLNFTMSVRVSDPEEEGDWMPCSPWEVTWCCPVDTFSPAATGLAAQAATEVLWGLSGRQFGFCDAWIRPCKQACLQGPAAGWPWPDDGDWVQPALLDGEWLNITCGFCRGDCGCSSAEQVTLPGVIEAVLEVQVDGVEVTGFRLDDHRILVRTDGGKWPLCQDWNLSGGLGTWFILTRFGKPVPAIGLLAVSELATEFLKACKGDPTCKLPQRVTSIDRNGLTIALDDVQSLLRQGQLGLTLADTFIATVNPHGLAQRSRVYSPDIMSPRVVLPPV